MEIDFPSPQLQRDHRMGAEMIELVSDILLCRLDQTVSAYELGKVVAHQASRRFSLPDPFFDRRQVTDVFGVQHGLHYGAIGVAAHNNVWDLQDCQRIFDGRRAAALHGAVGRDHVAGISQNEQLAGICLREECGVNAGVGTGNEEGAGGLVLRESGEEFFLLPEHLCPKLEKAFDELFQFADPVLSTAVLDVAIHREHEHPFADLHIDVGKEREGSCARDLADLFAQLVPPLRNEVLP